MNQNNLIKVDANSNELQLFNQHMKEYLTTRRESILETMRRDLNRKPGILRSIFPNKVSKLQESLSLEEMRNMFKTEQELLSVYTNTQLELAKLAASHLIKAKSIKYNSELSALGMEIQSQLSEFAQVRINKMSATFEKSKTEFGERRARQLQEAKKYVDDEVYYNRVTNNLNLELNVFMASIEDAYSKFIAAMNNESSKWSG
jgi:hypothetical protein